MTLPEAINRDFYAKELEISQNTREILERYSKIAPEKVVPHCFAIREKAWAVWQYPCIGSFRFLDLSVSYLPAYDEVINRLKTKNNVLLDLGCCFGQDLRRLVYDGAPSENLYGSDLRLDFMNMGYDLFLDKETLKSKFIAADVFDENSDLKHLDGRVDIIVTSAFFHLFDRSRQKTIAHRILKLFRPQKDALLIGRQGGSETPGERERVRESGTSFHHNPESWQRFWDEIGAETGTKWQAQAVWDNGTVTTKAASQTFADRRWLLFAVRRIE
ncbi:hypothetical protein K461DRAFT_322414 [Myriangium duriaei CBS 260.36]|uniref:Methyltransferase domain-containing protein n=1 Tax=Myriangium duriaei CBS 260.36 TaxID=1168546 RepID=A0A9P4J2B4_9PEZI|nr:hypothetical protein K461DRAFT_322414 [Myriangium duriaei CBS 260.36]